MGRFSKASSLSQCEEVLYLFLLAFPIGGLAGVLATIFGKGLLAIGAMREAYWQYLLPFLALGGLVIVFLYQTYGGKTSKGIGLLFDVASGKEEDIPKRLIPMVMLSTWLTHLFGGSAGREGVAVQFGGAVAQAFSRLFPIKVSSQSVIMLGMAAGFAGLFQTPLAAVCFALEVLVVGRFFIELLVPTTVAAMTASFISHTLGLEKFTHPLMEPPVTPLLLVLVAIAGVVFGVIGSGFAVGMEIFKAKAGKMIKNPCCRIVLGGLLLSFLLFLLHQGRYSGLGTNLIEASFSSGSIYTYDWLLKMLLTLLTLAVGFQGGEVTPLFSIGASLGVVLAPSLGLPVDFTASLGYISVFAAATNTFFAPLLIGGEVFGFANLPYYFIAVVVAKSIHPDSSIYPQKIH